MGANVENYFSSKSMLALIFVFKKDWHVCGWEARQRNHLGSRPRGSVSSSCLEAKCFLLGNPDEHVQVMTWFTSFRFNSRWLSQEELAFDGLEHHTLPFVLSRSGHCQFFRTALWGWIFLRNWNDLKPTLLQSEIDNHMSLWREHG